MSIKFLRLQDEDWEEVALVKVTGFEEHKRQQLAEKGFLFLCGDICKASVKSVTTSLLYTPASTVHLFLNTPGGEVADALALYDFLLALRQAGKTINTVAWGECFSAGVIILQAGTHRLITPNSYLLIHEIATWIVGRVSDVKGAAKHLRELQDRIFQILCHRSLLKPRRIMTMARKGDWNIPPELALKLKLVDGLYQTSKE